jgi:hypothetical protein
MRRTYVLTKAGSKARASRRSGLPKHYRQILELIRSVIHEDEIHSALPSLPPRQVDDWLDELDTLGFIALVAGSEQGMVERWQLAIR